MTRAQHSNRIAMNRPLPPTRTLPERHRGASSGFGKLVCRYEGRLLRFLIRQAGSIHDVEDLLQETFA